MVLAWCSVRNSMQNYTDTIGDVYNYDDYDMHHIWQHTSCYTLYTSAVFLHPRMVDSQQHRENVTLHRLPPTNHPIVFVMKE